MPSLDEYLQLRRRQTQLGQALLDRLSEDAIHASADALGFLEDGRVVLPQRDATAVLLDHALYDHRIAGQNMVQRALAANDFPEAREILEAMAAARLSVFVVEAPLPLQGARVRDHLTGASYDVMDRSFATESVAGDALVLRLLELPEMVITSGLAMPVPSKMLDPLLAALIMRLGADDGQDLANRRGDEASTRNALILKLAVEAHARASQPQTRKGKRSLKRRG